MVERPSVRSGLLSLAVAVPFVLGASAVPAEEGGAGEVVFRFQDPQVVESSGLVVQDGLFVTTNDSGDTGRVFAVDPSTGETVGVTRWAQSSVDVEALAPGGNGRVWVGDIGDNAAERPSVTVARVPIGLGERAGASAAYDLVYPAHAADAETLVAHPVTGRLYVATKGVFGGELFEAPSRLDPGGSNRLRSLGAVLPIATDGAFFPDGRHLLLRDYGRAVVYAFPSLERVGEVDLPEQEQGEGIAVDADGQVFVSSEGLRAPVWEVRLPPELRKEVTPPTGSSSAPPPGSRVDTELPETTAAQRPRWPWFLGGWLGVMAVVALVLSLRRR